MLTLLLLRDARRPARVQACLPEWIESVRQLQDTPNGRMDVEQLRVSCPSRNFVRQFASRSPQTEEAAMTIAEELRAEGKAEGEAKARFHALKKLMTLKFGPLSAEHATRIEATTEQQLDLYIERILTATTAAEVFASEV